MKKNFYWPFINTISLSVTLIVNALANALPINGMNTGQVAALYPSLFTPAGITFSIWSVIYILLIGFVVIQWQVLKDKVYFPELSAWFVLTCLCNASWILAWHYLYPLLSVVIMLALLYSLIKIFLLLRQHVMSSQVERAFVALPFTIYLAWICVATIANISAWLVSLSWMAGIPSPHLWTIAMMINAAALAVYMTMRFGLAAFAAVVAWALLGIYLKWKNTDQVMISVFAASLSVVVAVVFAFRLIKPLRQ
ncbi:MAG: tryptophan-rich sensory protein [Cyclobacteriaceae bacterium]|nr:tryptophan-rich sensory protein [Cyclobacteriaceae bacterium]